MNKKLVFEKHNNFNTIVINFYFPFTLKDKDIASLAILPSLLVKTNKNYPNENLFRRKLIDSLIIDMYCLFKRIGKERFLVFSLTIPDQKTIKEDILKESLKFFINTIYEPNIKNNQFDSKYFEIKKSDLELRIKNNLANVDFYNDYRLLQIVDPNGESTRIIENHQEQLKDLNPTTTYEFYKKIVLEKLPFIFVVGDVEKTKLESLFDELLFKNKPHNKIEKINYNFTDYLTKIKTNIIKEKGPYNQSCLSYVYKVKDMHFNDTPYLKIVNLLLSSTSSNLLMDSLRTEGKLVYYAGSYIYTHNGLLIIEARIGSKSYKEAKKRIEETFDKLKDQQIIKPLLTNVKKQLYLDLIRAQDNKYYFLNQLINCQTFKCSMNLNEEYEIIKNMTTKDIANFIKRLELDTIYYLEGEKDAA